MEIEVSEQEEYPDLEDIPVAEIAEFVCRNLNLTNGSCHIIFRNNNALQALHAEFFDDPSFTDVITFNLGKDTIEGEIYIAVGQAKSQSIEYKVPLSEEIARLIIHGFLHLKGYEDELEEDRKIMKEHENYVVAMVKEHILANHA